MGFVSSLGIHIYTNSIPTRARGRFTEKTILHPPRPLRIPPRAGPTAIVDRALMDRIPRAILGSTDVVIAAWFRRIFIAVGYAADVPIPKRTRTHINARSEGAKTPAIPARAIKYKPAR